MAGDNGERIERLYALVGREPLSRKRERLRAFLVTDRPHLDGRRKRAMERCLVRLDAGKSPAPFDLDDDGWNRDLLAALCLWGNPSPTSRHVLRRLADELPADVPLLLWADIDYGGLNILAQLRVRVSPRFAP